MSLRFTINYEVTNDSSALGAATQYYIIPQVTLKVGDNYLSRDYSITNFTAHVTALSWETAGTVAVPIFLEAIPVGTTKQGKITFDMICPPLPDDGSDNYFGVPSATADMAKQTGAPVDETDFTISIDISSRFLEIFDLGTPIVSEDKVLYISENSAVATEIYETNVRIGSAAIPNSLGRTMRWDGSQWNLASYWGQGVDTRDDFLGDLLARNILNSRDTIRRRLNGTIFGTLNPKKLLSTIDGKKWMFGNVTWDLGVNSLQGTWFELNYGTAGVNSTPIKIKVEPGGGTTIEPAPPSGGISNTAPGFNANPPPTVLAPVAYNGLDGEIDEGDVITSIPIKIASLGNEFLAGDGVTLVNPVTGQYQTFEIATAPAFGATSLSVVSEASSFVFPEDSYLVVKQNAYAFSLPTATQGQILRYNDTTDVWEAYSGTTDGHVLTWDTTNGWQSEAASGGGGLSDADYGDITVSGTGTVMTIDNGVVTFAKFQDINTAKLLGRITAGTGDVEEVSLNATLEFSGTTLRRAALTGDVTAPAGSNVTAIANNAVTTVTIANDAVTLAKLQNAVAANIVLGNIGIPGAQYAELTVANLYTLLGMTGVTNRLAIWGGTNNLASDVSYAVDAANGTMTIQATNPGLGAGAGTLNVNATNFTGSCSYLTMVGSVTGNLSSEFRNTNTGAGANTTFQIGQAGTGSGDPVLQFSITGAGGVTHSIGIDNSDGDKFKITPNSTTPGGTANSGLIVTNAVAALVGINKDTPAHPLDVGGTERTEQFHGINVGWVSGDFTFGLGAGTSPTFTAMSGTHNFVKVEFSTGTAPTANNAVFSIVRKTGYEFATKGFPVFSAANDKAAGEITKFYMSSDNGVTFTMGVNGTLTASTPYKFYIAFSGY